MTSEKFDGIVKARAQERIEARVEALKIAIGAALVAFVGELDRFGIWRYSEAQAGNICKHKVGAEILDIVRSGGNRWPQFLWDNEEEKVSKELLGIMDEMQKALIAADKVVATEFPKEPEAKETK